MQIGCSLIVGMGKTQVKIFLIGLRRKWPTTVQGTLVEINEFHVSLIVNVNLQTPIKDINSPFAQMIRNHKKMTPWKSCSLSGPSGILLSFYPSTSKIFLRIIAKSSDPLSPIKLLNSLIKLGHFTCYPILLTRKPSQQKVNK